MRQEVDDRRHRDEEERKNFVEEASKKKFEQVKKTLVAKNFKNLTFFN